MKVTTKNLIIFLCIIKLALSANGEYEEQELVLETTEEVTTERLKESNETEETSTLALELVVETTTLTLDLDVSAETTTTPAVAEVTTQTSTETSEATTTPAQELTTPLSVELENYAVKQMNFILDHILQTSYDFVSRVLQESDNTLDERDKLKRYAELLYRLLNDSNESSSDYDQYPEDLYNSILKKLTFLKGKGTRYLHKYLPDQWMQTYKNSKQDISIWLDKAAEEMHEQFNTFISDEDDQVKFQYFNEAFDDIPRANEIHQKLAILVDLLKIATNKKQITFMDLYMQS